MARLEPEVDQVLVSQAHFYFDATWAAALALEATRGVCVCLSVCLFAPPPWCTYKTPYIASVVYSKTLCSAVFNHYYLPAVVITESTCTLQDKPDGNCTTKLPRISTFTVTVLNSVTYLFMQDEIVACNGTTAAFSLAWRKVFHLKISQPVFWILAAAIFSCCLLLFLPYRQLSLLGLQTSNTAAGRLQLHSNVWRNIVLADRRTSKCGKRKAILGPAICTHDVHLARSGTHTVGALIMRPSNYASKSKFPNQ